MRGLVVVGLQKLSLEDEEPLARPTLRLEGGGKRNGGVCLQPSFPFFQAGLEKSAGTRS